MDIRDARPDDAAGIARIYNDAVRNTTAILMDSEVDAANRVAWMAARVALGYPVLVAVEDGQVMGYASFGDFRPFDGFRASVEHSVYVAEAARGQGLAFRLLSALIPRARACGKHLMIAGITSENVASLRLHEKAGFVESARMHEVGQKFGRWLDLVFMQLRLDQRPQP
ncbi:GNAT family N-acetyltransferase [Gemmobacter serpentinus]|uniref:GNAT family N-acetyltransferase n=1 Tax=Gemmobacter serpentinus TaxID=2652247 RepID=UPI00124E1E1B|nr:GNAT family N-acetyltransferase [Gemmobacter serpentinus]